MGSCAAPSAKGDDKFITTDYLQQCPHRPVEEPVKRKGSLKPYIFWRFIRRGTHQGAGIKSHSDAG
ncbi:hypothetical protein ELX76_27825 (plasmid) [Escherichia coli]|nr:hypothetical protein ELX76_27825 [Escherichia coli]